MIVLLLGSGGREHAFAWKIAQSPLLTKLYIAPGNAGTALHGENVNISPVDFDAVSAFVLRHNVGLVLVGPEDPLVMGIGDFFENHPLLKSIPLIGPCRNGAMLEGSKDFAKGFMLRHGIPTAAYRSFTRESLNEGKKFIAEHQPPYVLKASGLAAGKGVLIISHAGEAIAELEAMLCSNKFGKAGETVVIEEFLQGIELSVFVVTDGISWKMLPEAKDYKRIGEGDTGPNTGGMGTFSPVPFAGKDFMKKVEERIIIPTVEGLKNDHIPYKGFIFFGLMNVKGAPFVIEYNTRMGDPETESVLPRIESDFLELLLAVAEKKLDTQIIRLSPLHAATVMLVSKGYPGTYEKGKEISGCENIGNSLVFHAGTTSGDQGCIVTSGGRVMAVTSLASTLGAAFELSYQNAEKIHFEGKTFRNDLGNDMKQFNTREN